MKLRIGDKIKWNTSIGGGTIYTILDIDTTRPTIWIAGKEFKSEVLFQWEDFDGYYQGWGHSIDYLNQNLNNGGIIIVERNMVPHKELLKFSL